MRIPHTSFEEELRMATQSTAMAKQTGRCSKCGHSHAYHYYAAGEIVCSQCIENDRMAPCSPSS